MDTFAFIIHPIDPKRDVSRKFPLLGRMLTERQIDFFSTFFPPVYISEIEGIIRFGDRKKGSREIFVVAHDKSDEKKYNVPLGRHILVQDSDEIPAGEKITDGPVDPHDILKIKGTSAVQEYLVNEIQDVYRLQGVKINDKHIEVIVKQMLQKIKIVSPGDTRFLEEDVVDRNEFLDENNRVMNMIYVEDKGDSRFKNTQLISKAKYREVNADLERKEKKLIQGRDAEPATFEHLLLGITQAALSTESFISAASFQETTRVLTEASVAGKVDYLRGLKENVIVGRLIPAGTGMAYHNTRKRAPDEEPEIDLAALASAIAAEEFASLESASEKDS